MAGLSYLGQTFEAGMDDLLDFDKQSGLITAVVQDASSHRVLMVGFMNREALDKTLATGHVTFFSRSRKKLWTKGETSGHYLVLKSIATDCDGDALLVQAESLGPGVCHAGFESCFYRTWKDGEWIETDQKVYDPDAVYGAKQ
jgi:phosphoribosyl-AMP cyclohydrolase